MWNVSQDYAAPYTHMEDTGAPSAGREKNDHLNIEYGMRIHCFLVCLFVFCGMKTTYILTPETNVVRIFYAKSLTVSVKNYVILTNAVVLRWQWEVICQKHNFTFCVFTCSSYCGTYCRRRAWSGLPTRQTARKRSEWPRLSTPNGGDASH